MSMDVLVAVDAKNYEILSRVITQTAPRLDVMDLKIFQAPPRLAPPAISLQNFTIELAISFRNKRQARKSGADKLGSLCLSEARLASPISEAANKKPFLSFNGTGIFVSRALRCFHAFRIFLIFAIRFLSAGSILLSASGQISMKRSRNSQRASC